MSQKSIGELKHQRRRQLQKSRLKSGFALPQTLSRLFIFFNFLKAGKFSWSWILKDCIKVQKKNKKVVVSCSRPQQNVKLGTFTFKSWNDGYEMYQEPCCARANLLFCQSNPVAFLQFSLPSPSSLLQLPIVNAFLTDAWVKLLRTIKLRNRKMAICFKLYFACSPPWMEMSYNQKQHSRGPRANLQVP